jgi:hypothetical protein
MKYIYTFITVLTFGVFALAQVPAVDFESNGADYITASTGNTGTVTIVDDAVDAATYGKVANVENPAEQYDAWIIKLDNKISFADPSKKVLSVDFRDPTATARVILLKVSQGNDTFVNGDNAAITAYEVQVTTAETADWQTLNFDFSSAQGSYPNNAFTNDIVGEYSQLEIFIDFGTAVSSNTFVDNFRGGSQGSANVLPGPTASATSPTDTHAAENVKSIYSDAYTSAAANWDLNPGWGQATSTNEVQIDGTTDNVIRMSNLNYQGHTFDAIDASGMTTMHLDVWVENAGDLDIFIISLNPTVQPKVTKTLTAGQWVSLDIPLSDFTTAESTVNLAGIAQMKYETTAALGYIYVDNIYFWAPPSTDTEINFSVDTTNNTHYPNTGNGDVLAVSYSTDAGSSYTLSNPFTDDDTDGVWEGTVTLPKSTGAVQYQLVVTDATSGYTVATASTGDTLASEADFSLTTGENAVTQNLFLLDRASDATSWATLTASAVATVTVTIRGLHPDQTSGQYGLRAPGGDCYNLGDWTSNTDGVFTDTMTLPYYSTQAYQVGFHNGTNGWCGANMVSGNANTNTDFSVSVVEADVTEDLTAISAVDNNGNFIVYTSEGDLGNYPASQINFDEWAEADSRLNAENGAATSVVDDPSNSGKGKVLKLEYNDGNWQNVFIDIAEGSPTIKLDDTDRTITFEIWSDHGANAGQYGYLLKLEGELTTGGSVEKSFSLNGDAQWQTVTVDFSDCTGAPGNCNADNATGEYSRIRIFNWGGGDPSAQPDTSYVDNFIFQEGTVVPAAVDPITSYSENFDDGDSTWASADGASFAEADGYGTASSTNATDWAHVYFNSAAPLDLSAGDKGFSFKIKGPRASKVFLKLQVGDEYWNNHEYNPAEANYTTPGEWQTITVDATGQTSNDKTRIVIFFDTQTAASSDANQDVFQIDDFKFDVLATLDLADVNAFTNAITVYPNPTNGVINISGVEKVDAIKVFSINGQLVKEAVNTNRLDLSSQRSGLYMIEVQHEGATSVNKLIIR